MTRPFLTPTDSLKWRVKLRCDGVGSWDWCVPLIATDELLKAPSLTLCRMQVWWKAPLCCSRFQRPRSSSRPLSLYISSRSICLQCFIRGLRCYAWRADIRCSWCCWLVGHANVLRRNGWTDRVANGAGYCFSHCHIVSDVDLPSDSRIFS